MLAVEAALFSAGRPMSIQELVEASTMDRDDVVRGLADLRTELQARQTTLEVVRAGEKYAIQLKPEFAERARLLVPAEVPKHVLKTLALIAYHQPIRQSKILKMVGPRVYDHVQILEGMGLVHRKADGSTFELSTTEQFPEYFGISGLSPGEIRAFLAERMGMLPKPAPPTEGTAAPPPMEAPSAEARLEPEAPAEEDPPATQ